MQIHLGAKTGWGWLGKRKKKWEKGKQIEESKLKSSSLLPREMAI